METAPQKEGLSILCWDREADEHVICQWYKYRWIDENGFKRDPVAWMTLPGRPPWVEEIK
jgi:hypothetical protein